jgi:hypothetical protein
MMSGTVPPKQVHQAIYRVIRGGWQSPFATETGGLSPTGNSVASAEQTSAARPRNKPYQTIHCVIPGR